MHMLGVYLQHEVGLVEVNGTGCATGGLQVADFEVDDVLKCLRASCHGVQAAQDAVRVFCAGRGNGKDITFSQKPDDKPKEGLSGSKMMLIATEDVSEMC